MPWGDRAPVCVSQDCCDNRQSDNLHSKDIIPFVSIFSHDIIRTVFASDMVNGKYLMRSTTNKATFTNLARAEETNALHLWLSSSHRGQCSVVLSSGTFNANNYVPWRNAQETSVEIFEIFAGVSLLSRQPAAVTSKTVVASPARRGIKRKNKLLIDVTANTRRGKVRGTNWKQRFLIRQVYLVH
jgi:hypothetical protein